MTPVPGARTPTDEQKTAVDHFLTKQSLKINAFAGSGKTATLEFMAQATDRQGVYFAFNRSIADEARTRFPAAVTARTTHSYAMQQMPSAYREVSGKLIKDLNANGVADTLGLDAMSVGKNCYLDRRMMGGLVRETVKRFAQSDNGDILVAHVPHWGTTLTLSPGEFRKLASIIVGHGKTLWEKMIDPRSPIPLGHDGYLKLWAMFGPKIPTDFILLDEAQDSNGAVLGLLARQDCQVVYVGDRYQQIYEWRGAINAMQKVRTPLSADLTKSFRFGPVIADAASRIIAVLGEKQRIVGNNDVQSRLGCAVPDAVLCRTNAAAFGWIIQEINAGKAVHLLGGSQDLQRMLRGVAQLQRSQRSSEPEFFGFANWSDVIEFSNREEGQGIRTFVRLVDSYGVDYLKSFLDRLEEDEDEAALIVSTVHKAKGREWDRVVMSDDFSPFAKLSDGKDAVDEEEVRLCYVALTRAREEIGIPPKLAERFGLVGAGVSAAAQMVSPRGRKTAGQVAEAEGDIVDRVKKLFRGR